MSRKSPSKSKRLAKADLNFVSQQRFERVVEQLKNLRSRNVKPFVMQVDEDTAIFQLHYIRENNTTAEISGRLKRWAGNMTHIYCDGRVIRKRNIGSILRRRAGDAVILLILWGMIAQFIFGVGNYAIPLSAYIYIFLLGFIGLATLRLLQSLLIGIIETSMGEVIQFRNYFHSKPEAKDRERLFHAITSIIRDDEIPQHAIERLETKALTEEEETLLVAQITLEANKQNL